MATTTHLGVTLVEQAQAQKEITVNTALSRIDAVLNTGAITRTLATPPGSPAAGDVYIIAASPTGAWSGQANAIGFYDAGWKFITPLEGMCLWLKDEDVSYVFNGTSWQSNAANMYNTISTTTYTVLSTDVRKTLYFTNASAITLTLPNSLSVGFNCRIIQSAAGQITFTPAGGANRRNRQSHTKTAGQWAACSIEVVTNSGGSAAEYVLSGDTTT